MKIIACLRNADSTGRRRKGYGVALNAGSSGRPRADAGRLGFN
jgi:hypothetical protein